MRFAIWCRILAACLVVAGIHAATAPTLTVVAPLGGATEDTEYVISYAALQAAADEADADSATINFRIQAVSNGTLRYRAAGTTGATTAVTVGSTILDATRELVWKPAANANGQVNAFTVKAHDGALLSATAVPVPVQVAAVNDQPTITAITAKSTNEDTATAVIVSTVSDPDGATAIAALVLSGTSSNPSLVDPTGMVFGGTNGARTLIITPKANQSGTATITVTVTDTGTPALSASTSFVLTVKAVNDAPTLTTATALTGAMEDAPFVISYAALLAAADEADVDSTTINFRIEVVHKGTLRYRAAGTTGTTTAVTAGT